MQPPTAPPRDTLTVDDVTRLLRDVPGIKVGSGCELLDMALQVQGDITGDLRGGEVARAAYDDLHGTCKLQFATVLDWGAAIVRPYMTIAGGGIKARFNLGAYTPSIPANDPAEDVPTFAVNGYDILTALHDRVGDSYSVAAGVPYLSQVEAILIDRGYTQFVIDQDAAGLVLPSARSWPISDDTRWKHIVNELLGGVGYIGIYSDWDGRLRTHPYHAPHDRAAEWTYHEDQARALLDRSKPVEDDYFDAANRWVAVRANNVDGPPPVEGDGKFTYVNATDGPTSVAARGREITAPLLQLEVADQDSLVRSAMSHIDADLRRSSALTTSGSPMPMHWHFDRIHLSDSRLGELEALSVGWRLPLDGSDMSHTWRLL